MLSVEVIEMLIIRVGVDYRIKGIAVHDIKNILFLFGWQLNQLVLTSRIRIIWFFL